MRIALALTCLLLAACVTPVRVGDISDLAGDWGGRMAGPRGNAAAQITVDGEGKYTGVMFLDAGDRPFHGRLIVVRPGELRYVSTHGSGAARLYQEGGRPVLKLRGDDDGGVDATFSR
jgi:hypothetical protein